MRKLSRQWPCLNPSGTLQSIAAYYDYEIWQMDVKTAFLNGNLDESIYIIQPGGSSPKVKSKRFANCKFPFMDSRRHLDLGI